MEHKNVTVEATAPFGSGTSVRLDNPSGQLSLLLSDNPNERGNLPPPIEESPTIRTITSDRWIRRLAEEHGLDTHLLSTRKIIQDLIRSLEATIERSERDISFERTSSVAVFVAPDRPPRHGILNLYPKFFLEPRFGPYARGPPSVLPRISCCWITGWLFSLAKKSL